MTIEVRKNYHWPGNPPDSSGTALFVDGNCLVYSAGGLSEAEIDRRVGEYVRTGR